MTSRLEQVCTERGMRMSEQRRIILQVLDKAKDHPSAEEVHRCVTAIDPRISMATVYRTLNILAEAGLLSRVQFGDGKAHYEEARGEHHEHLIDVHSGKVLEFRDETIRTLLQEAAGRLGYHLLEYRLELFGTLEVMTDERTLEEIQPRGRRVFASASQAEFKRSHLTPHAAPHQSAATRRRRPARVRLTADKTGAG